MKKILSIFLSLTLLVIGWFVIDNMRFPPAHSFYLGDCKRRFELIRRLADARVPFSVNEKGAIDIGNIEPSLVWKKLAIKDVESIEPMANFECRQGN